MKEDVKLAPEEVAPAENKRVKEYLITGVREWQFMELLLLTLCCAFGVMVGRESVRFARHDERQRAEDIVRVSFPVLGPYGKEQENELYPLYCITQAMKTAPQQTIDALPAEEAMHGWDDLEPVLKERMERNLAATKKGNCFFPIGPDKESRQTTFSEAHDKSKVVPCTSSLSQKAAKPPLVGNPGRS